MGAGLGLIGPIASLASSAISSGSQGSGGSQANPAQQVSPFTASVETGNQFASSTGGMSGGPGTFNSTSRVLAQNEAINTAMGQNAVSNAQLANQLAATNNSGFANGFQSTQGNQSNAPNELGNPSSDTTGSPVV